MHILALCGSLRPQSTTLKAIQIAAEEIRLAGAECHIVSGKDMNLPLCWLTDEDRQHALVLRLQELAMEADGFLLASPEYHGNMSGVLKNALDWLGAEHFEGKPSALIAVAGGSQGAQSALSSLRTTIRCVHGWVLPDQVSIAVSREAFDPQGRPTSADVEKRLRALGRSLVRAAHAFKLMRDSDQGS